MTIYWRLKDVPELAPLAPKERRQVHEICFRRHFLHARPTRRSLFGFAALLSCEILVAALGGGLLAYLGASDSLWGIAMMTTGMMIGYFVFTQIAIPSL